MLRLECAHSMQSSFHICITSYTLVLQVSCHVHCTCLMEDRMIWAHSKCLYEQCMRQGYCTCLYEDCML